MDKVKTTTSDYYTREHLKAPWRTTQRLVVAGFLLAAGVSWWRGAGWTKELAGVAALIAIVDQVLVRPGKWEPPAKMGRLFPYQRDESELEERCTWLPTRLLLRPFVYPGCFNGAQARPKNAERLSIEAPLWPGARSTHLLEAHYYANKDAERLVVISTPNGVQAAQMDVEAKIFLQSGFAVLVWNYPGYGYSQGTPDYDNCIAGAQRVAEVADELAKGKELWFFGWSLGGPHAAEMALNCPESKLILDRTFATIGHFITFAPRLAQWLVPYDTLGRVQAMTDSKKRVIFHGSNQDRMFDATHRKAFKDIATILPTDLKHMDAPPLPEMIALLKLASSSSSSH